MFKVEPRFLPNRGIELTKPEQFLDKRWSPYCRNMQFVNEKIQGRQGIIKFDAYAFPDSILLIDQYWKQNSTYELMVATKRDIAKYDFSNTRYDFLTPLYTTGTIEVQVGTPTILRGTGTLWSTNLKAGDFVKIGSGSVHSDSTWYEVASVTNNTEAVMTTSLPTTAASTAYVARQTFTGSDSDLWQRTEFLDLNEGEIWCATNGVDLPIWYNGTGQVQEFTGLPTGFTAAKFMTQFYDRIVFAWTVEDGTNQPIRIRWGEAGNAFSYDDLAFNDLTQPDFTFWIQGLVVYDDYLVIPKESGAYVARPVDNDNDFDFAFTSKFFGSFSAYSNINVGGKIYYFGYENRFRTATIVQDEPTFEDLAPYTRTVDPTAAQLIYGYQVEYQDQVRWLLPYDSSLDVQPMIVYDYLNDVKQIWEYNHSVGFSCIGEYLNVEDLYVDDPVWGEYYVDEQVGYWDERRFLASAPIILYGGRDGIVYTADVTLTDDGNTYQRVYQTVRDDFGGPQLNKRLWKQQWWLDAETTGTVDVSIQRNDSQSFDSQVKNISLVDDGRDIIKMPITWDKEFESALNQLSASNHFALYGYLNWVSPKGKVVR